VVKQIISKTKILMIQTSQRMDYLTLVKNKNNFTL
jgi:hypothetical protein